MKSLNLVSEAQKANSALSMNELLARIEELEKEIAITRERADKDGLTGCLRREALFSILESRKQFGWLAKEVAVLVIDIDHFKKINDTHGHLVGDKALEHIGRILRTSLPEGALVSRIGGEEFVVIAEMNHSESIKLGEKIRKEIENSPLKLNLTQNLKITASLGIASWNTDAPLPLAIAQADEALYRAKKGGRNQVAA